jgi:hypothetical protein
MEKEDHSKVIDDNYNGNNFSFLWKIISAQFNFSIIKYEKSIEIKVIEDVDSNDYFYEDKSIDYIYKPKQNE